MFRGRDGVRASPGDLSLNPVSVYDETGKDRISVPFLQKTCMHNMLNRFRTVAVTRGLGGERFESTSVSISPPSV